MKALIVYGGYQPHTPAETARTLGDALTDTGCKVRMEESLEILANSRVLRNTDLLVPVWTMGELTPEMWKSVDKAVRAGMGVAGTHGGMGDAFRSSLDWQWLTGGHFVGHPHVGPYTVRITTERSPITRGMKNFRYNSEQYYMLIDPAVRVLADSIYRHDGKRLIMPVVWTNTWGKGRVFYSALGHQADEFIRYPQVLAMTVRGMLWAAGKQ